MGDTSGQVLGEGDSRSGSQLWWVKGEPWAGRCCPRIALALPRTHWGLGYSLPLPPWTLWQGNSKPTGLAYTSISKACPMESSGSSGGALGL